MQVSYNWLQQYIDIPWSPIELAEQLTMGGVEVDRITNRAEKLSGVVSGRIVRVEKHPNADKLLVCHIDIGLPQLVAIVTGATNVFEGAIVPTALAGAELPTGQQIELTDFRGVASAGMLCSALELGIDNKMVAPDLRDGIYILPDHVLPGEDIRAVLGLDDHVVQLELTPNRSDCLSLIGVAYEVAALTEQEIMWPKLQPLTCEVRHPEIRIDINAPDLCNTYLGLVVNNVRVGPSPLWMQNALQAAGMRPINNLVDITNYVLLELGQPLHAFDLDKLAGKQIDVRRAKPGEKIITLDGVTRSLVDSDLVIADADDAVALAGIMGSQKAEVTEATERVLLESAYFDYKSVRRSSRRLGLRTDASSRFDKGVDPGRIMIALQRVAQLLRELDCGEAELKAVGVPTTMPLKQKISLRPERVSQLLGVNIEQAEMRSLLERLGLTVNDQTTPWQVIAPSRRGDLQEEVDLIEEIARLYGFANIPHGQMHGPTIQGQLTDRQKAKRDIRQQLLGLGLTEVLTLSFTNPRQVAKVVGSEHPWTDGLMLANPLSNDRSMMRPSLLFGLLNVLAYNAARQEHDFAIFEVASVFTQRPEQPLGQPLEPLHLGVACLGKQTHDWQSAGRPYDFFYMKGLLETILAANGFNELVWQKSDATFLHPGRSAAIYWQGKNLGYAGELHPQIAEQYGLRQRAVVAELTLEPILAQAGAIPLYSGIPRYPAVARDLAIVVEQNITAAEVARVIRKAAGDLLIDLQLFDVYQGDQIAGSRKSLAYALLFQSKERTLLDAEVSAVHQTIVDALATQLGAKLR